MIFSDLLSFFLQEKCELLLCPKHMYKFLGALQLMIACLDDMARDEGTNVDMKLAEDDAKQLYKDGENRLGTNNKTFIDIFTRRNRPHLAAVDDAYHKLYGHSLEEVSHLGRVT